MKTTIHKITKAIFLVSCFLSLASASAQAPQKMSYQAVVRNASNTLITNANIRMRISVLQGTATGTAVYVETQTATTNTNGLVTLEIGAGTVVSGTFASISWGTNTYFIKTETDPTGGTNYTIVGTSQFLSVPYALFASSGNTGPAGPTGATGPAGPQGIQGTQGPIGLTGATGPQGSQGLPGANGAQGPIGLTGPAGPQGATGAQGPIGLTGTTGPQGSQGLPGANGAQGPIGVTGATGPQGIQGIPGAANISGSANKIIKFGTATTGVNSQISDDGTYVKIKPNAYTGFDEDLSMVQIAGSNNTLRLIGTGPTYGEFGKLSFGDVDRVNITEDIDDNLRINSYGRLAIMGENVGLGTLTPAEKLDVNGKTKTTNLQVTNGAGVGKVLTSDASGNANWVTPSGGITQFNETNAYNLSTLVQGADVDFATTNVTAPSTGTYLITYFLDGYNTFTCSQCITTPNPFVYYTTANIYNKTSNQRYQAQAIDFLLSDDDKSGGASFDYSSLPAHQVSGSLVKQLTANDVIGFKMRSFADEGSGGEIRIRECNITLVRLF